jgi:hypothetical protein
MPTVSQPKNLGDLLKYEAPNLYSRDQDTVAAAQNLSLGTVVGRETATAKLKALDPSASDGTETAVGVLGNDVDATLIDREDAILIARHAIVARGALIWPTGISTAHKVAAIKQLAERGVLARECLKAPDPLPTLRFTPPKTRRWRVSSFLEIPNAEPF